MRAARSLQTAWRPALTDPNARKSVLARQSFWDRVDTAVKAYGFASVNEAMKLLVCEALDAREGKAAPPPAAPPPPAGALKPLESAPAWMRRGFSGGGWR